MGKKNFITEDGYITGCASNVSKMNIFQFIWYFPEMMDIFGKKRKSNIFLLLLILFCPWIDEIYYLFKNNILNATILEFLCLILILILTFCGVGFVSALIISQIKINSAKKFCKKIQRM